MYTKKVMEQFMHPKNYGKLEKYNGLGKVGNPVCGDVMWLYIYVQEKDGSRVITDISFETFGCVAAIATSSIATELAKGKTIEEALKLNRNSVIEALGGLPDYKVHCSLLAIDALRAAIYDYLQKNKLHIPEELEKDVARIELERKIGTKHEPQ